MLLFAAIAFIYFAVSLMFSFVPNHPTTKAFMSLVRYGCPPVELLGKLALREYSAMKSLGCVAHSLALMTVYSTIGIVILCKRQFVCVRD
jgi:hypothetical protein